MEEHCMICNRIIPEGRHICLLCERGDEMQTFRTRIQTNGDRIRNMMNGELAAWLAMAQKMNPAGGATDEAWLEWLGKEATT